MKRFYILLLTTMLCSVFSRAQIIQVTDINPSGGSTITSPAVYNGDVYFEADDGSPAADELWVIRKDGTVEMVKDINTDPSDASPNSDPSNFTEYKGLLYFKANDGDNTMHDIELWVTDGTEANTHMVYDINPGVTKGSNPQNLFVFNNKLYFQANDGTSTEWWGYDGVSDPVKVTSLRTAGYASVNYPVIDAANARTFFQYNNENNRTELAILNADESVVTLPINPADHSYIGSQAILFNGKLIFQGDNGTDGDELWISDGTQAGTSMILDINTTAAGANSDPESFTIYNDKLYFVANPGTGQQLWITDGTAAGTMLVAEPFTGGDAAIDNLFVYGDKLWFTADDGTNGAELWVYDGNTASLFLDINTTPATGSSVNDLIESNALLFFQADDGTGKKVWVSDGSVENTLPLATAFASSDDPLNPGTGEFVTVGNYLFFTADPGDGDEFFLVDTRRVFDLISKATDINTAGTSGIASPAVYNEEVYFEADDGSPAADELWVIRKDGTVEMVKDINTDPSDASPNSDPSNFTEYKGLLYFKANDGDNTMHDIELWVTDGTEANTHMVYDINPGVTKGSNPQNLFIFNNKLYFQANDGTSTEWWGYDGVSDPVKVTSLRTAGYATVNYPVVDAANGRTFFQYNNDNNKTELAILNTDESVATLPINPADHSYIGSASILFNGKLIFQGDNGTDGDELWISDGTQAGTSMILDINTTAAGANSDPESFTIYNDKLYFVANPGTGQQLWITDGTSAGTMLVAEPFAGGDAAIENLYVYGDKLWFSATDGTNGTELWMYDGTAAVMFADINTSASGSPKGFTEVDGLMFFQADDGSGVKLWVSDGTTERTMTVAEALNTTTDPLNVNSSEFAVVGTLLYYTADNGSDEEFYVVDASLIFSYAVSVTVTDPDMNPLEGVEITLQGKTVTSDTEGKATFAYIHVGDLTYTATKELYLDATGIISLTDKDVAVSFVMDPEPSYKVNFTVTDGSNPLQGALVSFNGTQVNTDASGIAAFGGVYPATGLAYTVTASGYQDAEGSIDVVDADVNENVSLNLITYSVSFTITDGSNPIEGATVSFNGTQATTDASGTAVFDGLAPATGLTYTVSADGYNELNGTVDIIDASLDITLTLSEVAYIITFNVSDGTNPIEGATVVFNESTISTSVDGTAIFGEVKPATGLAYTVSKEGYENNSGSVDVDSDKQVDVVLLPVTGLSNSTTGQVSVYPNPSSGVIYIDNVKENSSYRILDMNGRIVVSGITGGSKISHQLDSGCYILLTDGNELQNALKIVVL